MPVRFRIEDIRLLKVGFSHDPSSEKFEKGEEDEGMSVKIEIGCQSKYDKKARRLRVDLELSSKDPSPSFRFSVGVGGVFALDGDPTEEELSRIRNVNCPAILFPYVREEVADLTRRAGLKPLHLPPANFLEIADKISEKRREEFCGISKSKRKIL